MMTAEQPRQPARQVDVMMASDPRQRTSRTPDFEAESRALAALGRELAENPGGVVRCVLELVLELCHAESAGLTILDPEACRWYAAAGMAAASLTGAGPREASPCSEVVARNEVLLFDRPARLLAALQPVAPTIQECLLAPWHQAGEPVGTLWAIAHTPGRQFDAEDARMLEHLARFASTAYQTVRALRAAQAGLADETSRRNRFIQERARSEFDLRHTRETLQAILDAAPAGVVVADPDGSIVMSSAMTGRILGSPVTGNAHGPAGGYQLLMTDGSPVPRRGLPLSRALDGETVTDAELRVQRSDGSIAFILASATPLEEETGRRRGAIAVFQDITERKSLEDERERRLVAEAVIMERQALLEQLVGAQEEERRRLAFDLHDGVTQLIAASALHLDVLASRLSALQPEAQRELERSRELVRQAVNESRRLIAGLRPTVLDDLGLVRAIDLEVESLRRDGWRARFVDSLGELPVPPAVEITLFRAVQEALNNIRRHAGPTSVQVRLTRRKGALCLTVRDRGRGFDASALINGQRLESRVGLQGMRERVALLGGRCTVKTALGAGTRVEIVLPIARLGERG